MAHQQTEEDFKRVMNDTTEMVRKGDLKKVLKTIRTQLDATNPSTMVAFMMLAGLMKDQGKNEDAHDLFKSVFANMKLDPEHRDVLSLRHNIALTSSEDNEKNRILVDIIATSSTQGYDDLLTTFSKSLEEFRATLTLTKRRLYEKIDTNAKKKHLENTIKLTHKPSNMSEDELDSLIEQFRLKN